MPEKQKRPSELILIRINSQGRSRRGATLVYASLPLVGAETEGFYFRWRDFFPRLTGVGRIKGYAVIIHCE